MSANEIHELELNLQLTHFRIYLEKKILNKKKELKYILVFKQNFLNKAKSMETKLKFILHLSKFTIDSCFSAD